MMKVKALVPWSNGKISMEQYEVLDLPDALAQNLIDAGIVVEIGGGSGGERFIVTCTPNDETFTGGQMDKTVGEIKQAVDAGMEVWFQFTLNENLTGLYACNGIEHYPNATFEYSFVAMFVLNFGGNNYLCRMSTFTISEDNTVWGGTIFPLTPAT